MSYGDTSIIPFSHQVEGYELLERENSFFIAWEQGTGKSKIIIDYCYNSVKKGDIDYALIVAPLSLLYNWKNEILKHQPQATVEILYGSKMERIELFVYALRNKVNFLLINYDGISVVYDYFNKYLSSNIALILDESHSIKNIRTRRFKLLSKLQDKFSFSKRFLLSGTPITQSPLDIFTQFYFIDKEIFGDKRFFTSFRARYVVHSPYNRHIVVGYRNLDELQSRMAPKINRVELDDCVDLPGKVYQEIKVLLPERLQNIYNSFIESKVLMIDSQVIRECENVLDYINIARQICNGFVYDSLDKSNYFDIFRLVKEKSSKLELIENLFANNPKKQFIIYYNFKLEGLLLKEFLDSLGISHEVIDGSVSIEERNDIVTRFQNEENIEIQFLLCQIQTTRLGLNLTNAEITVYHTNNHSVEYRLQSEFRNYRIGQDKKVQYVDIIYDKTIEASIKKALDKKIDLSKRMMDFGEAETLLRGEFDG